nr:hypothetical protein [Desulfobulbaceae bacterium]
MADNPKESLFEKAEWQIKKLTSLALKISIIIIFSVVAWRISLSSISFDLSKFDFSDLLAMILALFAMAMSVAFYFKSTDSTNQFYDNIYNFTQKTSEILGRIEERFGERLKHIDEGYGRIQSRFDGISNSSDEIEKKVKETEGKEEEEKRKLEEANKAMGKMLETLTQKAKLEQKDKEEFYQKMGELAAEKDMAQKRIQEMEVDRDHLQSQLHMMENDMMEGFHEIRHPIMEKIYTTQNFTIFFVGRHLLRL